MPPKMILVPIDFGASSQEALEVATDMASRLSALLLVHIVPAIKATVITSEARSHNRMHSIANSGF